GTAFGPRSGPAAAACDRRAVGGTATRDDKAYRSAAHDCDRRGRRGGGFGGCFDREHHCARAALMWFFPVQRNFERAFEIRKFIFFGSSLGLLSLQSRLILPKCRAAAFAKTPDT